MPVPLAHPPSCGAFWRYYNLNYSLLRVRRHKFVLFAKNLRSLWVPERLSKLSAIEMRKSYLQSLKWDGGWPDKMNFQSLDGIMAGPDSGLVIVLTIIAFLVRVNNYSCQSYVDDHSNLSPQKMTRRDGLFWSFFFLGKNQNAPFLS